MNPTSFQNFHNTFRSAVNANAAAGSGLNGRAGMNNWLANHPNRANLYANRGTTIRNYYLGGYGGYGGLGGLGYGGLGYGGYGGYGGRGFFGPGFWIARSLIGMGMGYGGYGGYGYGGYGGYGNGGWWGYQPWGNYYPYSYWYGNPGWNTYAGMYGWNQPYYYDYGTGGNVVYQDGYVYVNGQPVGTYADYSNSAAALATVDPAHVAPTDPKDWTPLGTFSVATTAEDNKPTRVAQLAVNKAGLVSGTWYNAATDKAYTIQGRVDKDTQRLAFTIGDNHDLVLETGMYNLTQQEAPVLAHLGPDQTANYLFVRLPEPKEDPNAQPANGQPATGQPATPQPPTAQPAVESAAVPKPATVQPTNLP
jgi:hypothetical protein